MSDVSPQVANTHELIKNAVSPGVKEINTLIVKDVKPLLVENNKNINEVLIPTSFSSYELLGKDLIPSVGRVESLTENKILPISSRIQTSTEENTRLLKLIYDQIYKNDLDSDTEFFDIIIENQFVLQNLIISIKDHIDNAQKSDQDEINQVVNIYREEQLKYYDYLVNLMIKKFAKYEKELQSIPTYLRNDKEKYYKEFKINSVGQMLSVGKNYGVIVENINVSKDNPEETIKLLLVQLEKLNKKDE